jgi:hypothetical protein
MFLVYPSNVVHAIREQKLENLIGLRLGSAAEVVGPEDDPAQATSLSL